MDGVLTYLVTGGHVQNTSAMVAILMCLMCVKLLEMTFEM